MIIVVDSDGLIGSLHAEDIHYQNSHKILSRLVGRNYRLIYPATVIVESVTFLQGRLNKPELASKIIDLVNNDQLEIEPVDNQLLQQASGLMNLNKGKHHTLFDCIVAAIAQKYQAEAIFSFDKFYPSEGFKLAGELKEK